VPGCPVSHHGVEDGEEFSGECDEGVAAVGLRRHALAGVIL